jgi:arginine N-succinyltransferase
MLEKIGFKWKEHIDPFDGGPHFWAETDKISLLKNTKSFSVAKETLKKKNKELALCGFFDGEEFKCMQTTFEINRGKVSLPKSTIERLKLEPKASVSIMPFL